MMKKGNARAKVSSSYMVNHESKMKVKDSVDAGGKMTKFRNLDDIPDTFPDNVEFEKDDDQDYDNFEKGVLYHSYSAQVGKNVERNRTNDSAEIEVKTKVPPLPYDQKNHVRGAIQRNPIQTTNHIPAPPNSKYFDYDNSHDDFEEEDFSPRQPAGSSTSTRGGEFVPPLPCESGSSKSSAEQQDSIYFSKKPRPVNFKPYTLKQYKMTQPKEYVEISNIKPDLNSEELVAKRANLERIKEFSKNLQSFNRQTISQQPKLPPAAEKRDIAISEQKFNSRRQKAIEFAKSVPKPRVPSATQTKLQVGSDVESSGKARQTGDFNASEYSDRFGSAANLDMGAEYAKESRIMELEAQHNNRKIQIEAMKKSMGLK